MIGKELIEERDITPSEVKSLLSKVKKEKEFSYEQKQAYEYANDFGKVAMTKAKDAIKKLQQIEKIDEHTAVMLVTNAPKDVTDVKLITEKKRFDVDDATASQILDIVKVLE